MAGDTGELKWREGIRQDGGVDLLTQAVIALGEQLQEEALRHYYHFV